MVQVVLVVFLLTVRFEDTALLSGIVLPKQAGLKKVKAFSIMGAF